MEPTTTHTAQDNNATQRIVQNESAVELAQSLAGDIVTRLSAAIDAIGEASLVVSGGSTPTPLFEALRAHPIEWSKVFVTLADERWVPDTNADSNEAFVKNTLLKECAADARFVSLYVDGATPEDGVAAVHRRLSAIAQPFTVVVLGMGGDGHTASLFPDAPGTTEAMTENRSLVSIVKPATVPQARITLTLAALMNTECQFLHITGQQKRELVNAVLADPGASPYPIARFLQPDNAKIMIYSTH